MTYSWLELLTLDLQEEVSSSIKPFETPTAYPGPNTSIDTPSNPSPFWLSATLIATASPGRGPSTMLVLNPSAHHTQLIGYSNSNKKKGMFHEREIADLLIKAR